MLKSVAECYRLLHSVTACYRVLQSFTESYRVLQSVAECCRVLQRVRECYRMLQSITKTNLAHLLRPFFWLVFILIRICILPTGFQQQPNRNFLVNTLLTIKALHAFNDIARVNQSPSNIT